MQKPKAFLFDLDNTLISRKRMFEQFSENFVKDMFPHVSEDAKVCLLATLRRIDHNGESRRPALFYRLCAETGVKMPSQWTLLDYWNNKMPEYRQPEEGMEELLALLREKGIKLALVTNGAPELQNNKIDSAGIRDAFDRILISGEYPFEKPDTRLFELALREVGVRPEEAVFAGDHLINDVYGAQQAGIPDVWVNLYHETNRTAVRPTYEIHKLAELIETAGKW